MTEDFEAIKKTLSELARQKNKRQVGIGPKDPPRWTPGSVIDPCTKKPFTHAGAWEFIADELEKQHTVVHEKLLKKPLGKVGYEFCVRTEYQKIYIKVRLSNGIIIGRSFHVSTERKDNGQKKPKNKL